MVGLVQRVTYAMVKIDGKVVAEIGQGLLALIGIESRDSEIQADRLLQRMLNYRVFANEQGRMDLNLSQIAGGLLLVPQFTLLANTTKGNRASFSNLPPTDQSQQLFDTLVSKAKNRHAPVASGVFAADMQVALLNDGPVTFWLQAA